MPPGAGETPAGRAVPRGAVADAAVREPALAHEGALVAALLAASLLMRGVLAAVIPLFEAEAYYWLWSRQLDFGYVDHPPGVALMLRLTTGWGWLTPFAARLGSLLLGTAAAFLFHRWCRALVGPRVALRCLLVFCIAPFAVPMAIGALPDAPLQFFWVACLLAFTRAHERHTLGAWLLLGLLTGFCIGSKYNGFLLFGVYGLALVLSERGRAQLRSGRPWAGLVLALLVAAPNLLWNARHGGVTLATPVREGIELGRGLYHLAEFLSLPILLLTPVLAVAFVWRLVAGLRAGRLRSDPMFRLLCCASLGPLAVFAAVSLLTQIHPHWAATAFVAAVPLTLAPGPGPGERLLRRGIGTALVVLVLLIALPVAAVLVPWEDPPKHIGRLRAEVFGRPALAQRVATEIAAHDDGRLFLASPDYHLTALLEWTAGGELPGLPLQRDRFRQYAVWYSPGDLAGWSALVVTKAGDGRRRHELDELLAATFESVHELPSDVVSDGNVAVRRWDLFLCRGFKGPR